MVNEIREREIQVLCELMKNGRATDKYVARKIGTTQPTVTRIRQKLERDGLIQRYHAVVDYAKTGIGVVAITFWTWVDYSKKTERSNFMDFIRKQPHVMFLSRGEGIEGRTTVMISAHKDFKEYEDFVRDVRRVGGTNISRISQFISSPGFYKQYDSTSAIIHALAQNSRGFLADGCLLKEEQKSVRNKFAAR